MKGDFTRSTFDRSKHYRSVRMQQGRVQLDADWNEQADIVEHRVETEARDVIGLCGGPLHHDGFHVVAAIGDLSAEENARPENQNPSALAAAGDFYISGGRYYVDGVLCQNERIVTFGTQPDLPNAKPIAQPGVYFAYLDVWSRHITALDDDHIREVALGGPDTATRVKTIAQVKCLSVGNAGANIGCLSSVNAWDTLIAPSTGRLRARSKPDATSPDPCVIKPGSGYRRLENQLYRVEIHTPGAVGTATYAWSRDNGAIVASWLGKNGDELTVSTIGRDEVLRFATDQWIELIDDSCELEGRPGTLVQVLKAEGQVVTIKPATATGPVAFANFPLNRRVRRWDGIGTVTVAPGNDGYLPLEDGVEVRFQGGTSYKTGDYWTIPARTNPGQVEWPVDGGVPKALPPEGIQHHYCRLAVLDFDGAKFTKVRDCRNLFPSLTEWTDFLYLSGDGQEAAPEPGQALVALPQPLRVGVLEGDAPLAGARVRFTILGGNGQLPGGGNQVIINTDADGVAACAWKLDTINASQQVEARLLDASGQPTQLPIRFNANLSRASDVSYDPKSCPNLASAKTVQDALDILCKIEQGGGCCCVAIGKGGEFEQLDKAIKTLIEKETDICLCLMPGEHHLPGGLAINPKKETHVRIAGCGRATRLYVHDKALVAANLASFTLSDMSIFPQDKATVKPLQIIKCKQLNITGCFIRQQQFDPTDLLTIEGAERIVIADNVIESFWWPEPIHKFLGIEKLGENTSFDILMSNAAAKLAKGGPKAQSEFVKKFKKTGTASRTRSSLSDRTESTLSAISAVVISPGKKTDAIAAFHFLIQLLVNAPAIVIADAGAEVFILNNSIKGEVRLYGTQIALTEDKFKSMALNIRKGSLSLAGTGRDAKIAGNALTEVTVDSKIATGASGATLSGLFNRLSLLNNTFSSPHNEWLAEHVVSDSNHFTQRGAKLRVGIVACGTFICVATSAENPLPTLQFAVSPAAASQPQPFSANLINFNAIT